MWRYDSLITYRIYLNKQMNTRRKFRPGEQIIHPLHVTSTRWLEVERKAVNADVFERLVESSPSPLRAQSNYEKSHGVDLETFKALNNLLDNTTKKPLNQPDEPPGEGDEPEVERQPIMEEGPSPKTPDDHLKGFFNSLTNLPLEEAIASLESAKEQFDQQVKIKRVAHLLEHEDVKEALIELEAINSPSAVNTGDSGRLTPRPYKVDNLVPISARIPAVQKELLLKKAESRGISRSVALTEAVEIYNIIP